MLCRMIPRKTKKGKVPVYLNVYDLTPMNGYAYWLGLGVYHSGVQGKRKFSIMLVGSGVFCTGIVYALVGC